ncbi:mitochondrial large ribosomal subunit [Grosmannia clavigera kw1407]|uniref:Mitochondrial large ribosomal subunit n=1 Tax=Grosmannia clavigera (strain kw1407 / UAMH 11150) TaxID=655863 RepID=F0XE94_GROCL|nr:mitochondrial large ribosomal subunit [Grosmannia clavigera kw1407]EFX04393.1 mitochondrial large ribosomal subunit [Grosmannia clavigera kw1407]
MPRYTPAARPLVQCLRGSASSSTSISISTSTLLVSFRPIVAAQQFRPLSSTATAASPDTASSVSSTPSTTPEQVVLEGWELDPDRTTLPWAEKELMRRGTPPVGSRRRRAALRAATDLMGSLSLSAPASPVPFELMPYQCFQEARKVLQSDREDKLRQIAATAAKIRKLEAVITDPTGDVVGLTNTSRGGEPYRQRRLASLRQHVEELKILADINDPLVKRRFEDGLGDMNKPIYRYLAEQRWRDRPLRLLQQRIDQFHLAPDLLPAGLLQPRADVELFFRSYSVAPGAIVDSLISEVCPRLRVQVFDRGMRLVSVVVVDADVPDWEADSFTRRCHFLAANIPLAPSDASVPLSRLDPAAQLVLPWLPAYAQKGSAPHRFAVLVLEQQNPLEPLDHDALTRSYAQARNGFDVRRFVDKFRLSTVGCTLFRSQWDAGTEGVMARAAVPGADLELKPIRLPSLKPPRKARGWEAKHQGPKYRHLWKFTHRIATPKRRFVR